MEEDNDNSNMQAHERTDADDVKDRVKGKVQKGVAAVAGALKGFSEEAKKHDLAGSTKQAIQKAGETTREVAGTATREFKKTKEHLKQGSSGASGTFEATPLPSSTTSVPDLRKTDLAKDDEDLER